MATFSFTLDAPTAPERVLAALTDFSDNRPVLWPTLSRKIYKVHKVGPTSADVTEGSDVFGGIWAREIYDWSSPGVVTITLTESPISVAGGTWTYTVRGNGTGGSTITCQMHRTSRGVKGRLVGAFAQVLGARTFRMNLQKTIDILGAKSTG